MSRGSLQFEWTRLKLSVGDIRYVARVTQYFALTVWRSGSYWQWVLSSTAELSVLDKVILAHGGGPTMNEAKLRAERWALEAKINPPQMALPLTSPRESEDIPF